MNIKETAAAIHENNRLKGFWDKERNFSEMIMLVVTELAECVEAHREGRACRVIVQGVIGCIDDVVFVSHFKDHVKDTIPDELADAVIRILDICERLGIDIEAHIAAKMRYNATRPRLHGKKY